jgi:hypothetical protein
MFKFVIVLVIGIAIGYFYGFDDARKHDENVVERVVDSVGKTGSKYQMDAAEKR